MALIFGTTWGLPGDHLSDLDHLAKRGFVATKVPSLGLWTIFSVLRPPESWSLSGTKRISVMGKRRKIKNILGVQDHLNLKHVLISDPTPGLFLYFCMELLRVQQKRLALHILHLDQKLWRMQGPTQRDGTLGHASDRLLDPSSLGSHRGAGTGDGWVTGDGRCGGNGGDRKAWDRKVWDRKVWADLRWNSWNFLKMNESMGPGT